MNRADLITAIATKTEGTKKDADKYLSAVIESITDTLVAGEKLSLLGFGSFEVVERAARMGRNPQTGMDIEIPASKAVKFKAGKTLRDAVKNA